MERQPISLATLVRRAVQRVGSKSPEHRLLLRLPAKLPTVDADPRRIEQVLHNLLDNAVKYSPEGGTVTVSAAVQLGSMVVSVADQGIGIPLDEQSRVFERFYRATAAPSVSRRGVGLGLYICQGIVEAHGGSIWLESSPGSGTTVRFSLPVGETNLRAPSAPPSLAGKGAGVLG